ncbi:Protein phosphatase 2C 7 [Coemansia spiralis]|uniref:Protein phosphatase n=2 Tax=Coemansia TaxID=4863 RepID=A0A9W8G4Z5_9FUNG|nr:phosphatase 2C-like domain-containing protein [Coemansia spiralis]KAJ1987624.1 Protein phosphatase 2C 7 [Coemansia umbellata]KAJ2620458.1 Protein phosphatase 2C 7 [Coemansia sp. RSA 1358]KAJ2674987.1 Protein phosphatase 2C 7 [Coemansia spiralis]
MLINNALRPRYQAILASAWISKRSANHYVQEYVKRVQEETQKQSKQRVVFDPPIQVQVLKINDTKGYEPLDAINGGEDSLFHAQLKQNLVFGVSDGVGGWNESGIDPSVFSRSLTAYSAAAAENTFLLHESDEADPKDIMRRAFAAMRYDSIPAYGSATELVLSLSLASGRLRTAQLGDSTYVILDPKQKARFVSAEQQHRFNMPYQLTIPPTGETEPPQSSDSGEGSAQFFRPRPATEEARSEVNKDDFSDLSLVGFDTPSDAREESHTLGHDDIVVAATDGLFDNVTVDEVEKLADRFMQAIGKLKTINGASRPANVDLFGGLAYSIAAQAVTNYIQHDLKSPFAERAKLAGYSYTGGKPDDVTVMLAWIRETSKAEAEEKLSQMKPKL